MNPTRTEEIVFSFTLDAQKAKEFEREVRQISPNAPALNAGDTLAVSYRFFIEYFGQVAATLEAIEKVAKAGVVVKFDSLELQHGKSLIVDCLGVLNRLGSQEKERDA